MQYQLNIMIDDSGLQQIYETGQSVTIVRTVTSSPPENLPIAWLTFQPLEENTIVWSDSTYPLPDAYSVYATTQPLQPGATLVMSSVASAQPGWTYTFKEGVFNAASSTGDSTITITNLQEGPFSFGLAQQAVVNNVQVFAPLNGVPLQLNQSASFVPGETVSIFLSVTQNNGVVLFQVPPTALVVTLTSQQPVANIGFNQYDSSFYLQNTPSLASEASS
jgi:hypothetical protein